MSITQMCIEELRKSLEADFLLLTTDKKMILLNQYGLNQESPDFTNITLAELWFMEIFILKHLSKTELCRRTWIIREKFRLQVGDAIYETYKKNLPDCINEDALKQIISDEQFSLLQEDAANLARQMQRMNYFRMLRTQTINRKKKYPISIFFILLGAVTYVFSDLNSNAQNWQLIFLTIFFGMIGAVVSLLQRLEQAANIPTNFTDSAFESSDIGQGMSPLYMISLVVSGAVFSILIYLLSHSQLVNILELLPKPSTNLECQQCSTTSFLKNLLCAPFDSTQTAKLLILCFISGFAERFVPDVLDGLVKKTRP